HQPRGTAVVLTDTWNGDRYLHLALQEAGYTVSNSAASDSSCRRVSETLDKGDRRVVHIRLHQPFLREWRAFAAARFEQWGAPCISTLGALQTTLVSPFARAMYLLGDSAHAFVPTTAWSPQDRWPQIEYDPNIPVTIPATSLE